MLRRKATFTAALAIVVLSIALLSFFLVLNNGDDGNIRPDRRNVTHAEVRNSELRSQVDTKVSQRRSPSVTSSAENKSESEGLAQIRRFIQERNSLGLRKVIQDFEKGEYREVWGLLRELPDGNFMVEVRRLAINRAALLEDFDAVFELIRQETGAGMERNRYLETLFAATKTSLPVLFEKYSTLENSAERAASLAGLKKNISRMVSLNSLSAEDFKAGSVSEFAKIIAAPL